ncbi:ABC transporter ATP-binding protein [Winogradskyella aurantiaca]|uniref:ABC transporter ATP-binding protein n=1 Tax=Winogradskyella aurantiaca TaxID=2219558 RepID=UPI000E1D1F43|nr:ABC transporter ATP-binding protein [Winogradskyella aurantiaca]
MDTIVINNLEFRWEPTASPILTIDHLKLKKNSSLFLQGPSGSGKSTLLSLLAGILVPQSGTIEMLGQSIHQLRSKERDKFRADHVGYIFQMFNLLPYLSVLENVTLPCSFSKSRFKKLGNSDKAVEKEALRLLNKLGFSDKQFLNKPVTELSLGQQQRVAACRALMGSPEILIADEPTSALDADAQENFLTLLNEECKKNEITLIFVSHDERLAQQFDQVARLRGGNITVESLKGKVL